MPMTPEQLKFQYQDIASRAERLREAIVIQLTELLSSKELTLGVPIESRVKDWASIEEKLQRKKAKIDSIFSLEDLIGVRAILLFRSDLEKAINLINETFDVISLENTASRLSEAEFGYQSQHFTLRLPKAWLSLPTLMNLNDFVVELQVRTLAQHIWAAASHKLQYKQEEGVPPPLRRTINRVSALLETVDLEFERVLEERQRYIASTISLQPDNEPLNVDNLSSLLSELLPPESKIDSEPYADLLRDLRILKIYNTQQLRIMISTHRDAAKQHDQELIIKHNENSDFKDNPRVAERLARGVFYNHVGLVREALRLEFGRDRANAVFNSRINKKKISQKRSS